MEACIHLPLHGAVIKHIDSVFIVPIRERILPGESSLCPVNSLTLQHSAFQTFFSHSTVAIQNMHANHQVLKILMPTFRILVFRDVSLWKPKISQLLLSSCNAITRQRRVYVYTITIKQYLGIHFRHVFLCISGMYVTDQQMHINKVCFIICDMEFFLYIPTHIQQFYPLALKMDI